VRACCGSARGELLRIRRGIIVRSVVAPANAVCERLVKQAVNLGADIVRGRIGVDDGDGDGDDSGDSDSGSVASGGRRPGRPAPPAPAQVSSVLPIVESPLLGAEMVEMICPANSTVSSIKQLLKERIPGLEHIADGVYVVVRSRPAEAPRRHTVAEIHRGNKAAAAAPDRAWKQFVSSLLQIRQVIGGVHVCCYIRQHVDSAAAVPDGPGGPAVRGRGRGRGDSRGGHHPHGRAGAPAGAAHVLRVVVAGLGEDRAAVDAIALKFDRLLSTFATAVVRVSQAVWSKCPVHRFRKQFHVGVDRNAAGGVALLSGKRSAVQLAEEFLKVGGAGVL
jgi:hypothetical protein